MIWYNLYTDIWGNKILPLSNEVNKMSLNLVSQRIEYKESPFILSRPMPFIKSYFDLIKLKEKVLWEQQL